MHGLSAILPGGERQGVSDRMDDAGRDRGARENRTGAAIPSAVGRLLHISRNTLRQTLTADRLHRRPCQVRVPGRGLHLPVPEQLPYHRQALFQRERPAGKGVAQIMDSYILQSRSLAHHQPR